MSVIPTRTGHCGLTLVLKSNLKTPTFNCHSTCSSKLERTERRGESTRIYVSAKSVCSNFKFLYVATLSFFWIPIFFFFLNLVRFRQKKQIGFVKISCFGLKSLVLSCMTSTNVIVSMVCRNFSMR